MATVVKALRPLRRELNSLLEQKPGIRLQFQTAQDRDSYVEDLRDYYELLSTRKASFKDIQRQYLEVVWQTEADQKAAVEQAEYDAELLTKVDRGLTEVNCAIRRLSAQQAAERQHAQNINAQQPPPAAIAAAPAPASVTHLPKLSFPTFNGDILTWQTFWDRFRVTVHDNQSLTAVDKMSFLAAQLTGEAASTISGLAITEANYAPAVNMLQERYGNTSVIIDAHYTALMEIPPASKPKELRPTIDKIELHLNALKAVGEDVNHRQFATLIRSKLPPSVIIQMEKEKKDTEEEWDVDQLREHLRKHIQICETAYSRNNGKNVETPSIFSSPSGFGHKGFKKPLLNSTTATLVNQPTSNSLQRQQKASQLTRNTGRVCPYCDQSGHFADQCTVITTATARKKKLQERHLCFNCLEPGHPFSQCKRTKPCFNCKQVKSHHTSICAQKFPDRRTTASMVTTTSPIGTQGPPHRTIPPQLNTGECQLLAPSEQSLLQTTTGVFVSAGKAAVQATGIFDCGSHRSFITEKLATSLQLNALSTAKLSVHTFGTSPPKKLDSKLVKVSIRLLNGTIFTYAANVVPVITGNIHQARISNSQIMRLFQDLPMADKSLHARKEAMSIDFLIGADYMWEFVQGERITLAPGLHLINSTLGWLLGGRQQDKDPQKTIHTAITTAVLYTADGQAEEVREETALDIKFLWDQETLGIKEPAEDPGDGVAIRKFNETVVYQDGRYFVTWPWKGGEIKLPSNYGLALGRLKGLIRKYSETQAELTIFEQYHQVIQQQLEKGVIEKVTARTKAGPVQHYIPHHAVITPGKTTKLRIVYDASAKAGKDTKSLNECLFRGPVLLDDVVTILLRFRMNPIAVAADIEKAFLQVGLHEADKDVTRFLWLRDPKVRSVENNIQIYRFTRVPFGFTSSPFLLSATIQHHLQRDGGPVANKIQRDIYVDNIISGVDTPAQAIEFYAKTKELFKTASMNAREWMTNSQELAATIPEEDLASGRFKILGLHWDPSADTLRVGKLGLSNGEQSATKRTILQAIASIFDPVGFFCPATLRGKMILQQLWIEGVDWDTPVPDPIQNTWAATAVDLSSIPENPVPRLIGNGYPYELHCFCDASQSAYGICIYLRTNTTSNPQAHLAFAKARVAPVRNTLTIPRLELMAARMGSTGLQFIAKGLPAPPDKQFLWTDSQCVLHWLNSQRTLPAFVQNRVNQIKAQTGVEYRYIETEQNPADIASRGLSVQELANDALWWNGPTFLQDSSTENWPSLKVDSQKIDNLSDQLLDKLIEHVENSLPTIAQVPEGTREHQMEGIEAILDSTKFSSLTKLLRTTAWCLRACSKTKPADKNLTAEELIKAKTIWIQAIQRKHYNDIFQALQTGKRHQMIGELGLWIDDLQILRCGGRLQNANIDASTMHPILLPKSDHFTNLIIRSFHLKAFHAGVSHTLANIRKIYWIPAGRATVFKVLRTCHSCKRYDGGPYKAPPMPALPTGRVTPSGPFTITGLDYLGPLLVKEPADSKSTRKVWICLFTCLTTRAVHLELIPDMSAAQFLMCFRRFCGRRGVPAQVYSDNASQFKLVKSTLDYLWAQALHDPTVLSYVAEEGIQWKFITEQAPWMGGYYERLVRLVKQSLRKSLGRVCLTFIQLQTVLTEVEAAINTRPLVYVGATLESGHTLTPAHFLSPTANVGIPSMREDDSHDPNYVAHQSSREKLLATWKKGQNHLEQFWRIWREDYLLSLRERPQNALKQPHHRASEEPAVGHIVHIKNDGPRGTWFLGQISELIRSADEAVRSVVVRLPTGRKLTRSVLHIYPLEVTADESAMMQRQLPQQQQQPHPQPNEPPTSQNRPKRKAAQVAQARIKAQHREEEEAELICHPRKRCKTSPAERATKISNRYAIAILLFLCSFIRTGKALQPLICQAQEAKLVLDLSISTACPVNSPAEPPKVTEGNIQLFKRNIARYESPAYKCTKIKTVKSAWTGFAKAGWDHSATEIQVDVSKQECRAMVQTHHCPEGPLVGSDSLAFTENNVEYPYTTGNLWDCCQWYTKEVTNCYITKGKVYETFGKVMESNLGNTATCEYMKKSCILSNKATLIWETEENAKCEFTPWKKITGKHWGGRFLSDDQEVAVSWNAESPRVTLCDGTMGTMTDQGIPILYSFDHKVRKRAATEAPTDITAARLQALEERLNQVFTHGLNSAFNQVCRTMQKMQTIDLILAHAEPTLIARHAINEPHIMAKISGNLMEVWPCAPVEDFYPKRMLEPRCTEWIPVNVTVKKETIEGYLDPKTNIVFQNSAPADCSMVEEVHLRDETGQLLVYLARFGTIKPFKGSILSHPLYRDNLTLFSSWKEVIHKPLSIYSLDEIRAQFSLNDVYDTAEKTQRILEKLADISNNKPENNEASKILELQDRYTPWGLLSGWMNYLRHIWVYLCCAYTTVNFLWNIVISKLRLALAGRAIHQAPPGDERETPALTHGPVEKFLHQEEHETQC